MKKYFVILLMFVFGVPAFAQTQTKTATFSWVASTTTGVAGYNLYQAPCTGTVTNNTCSQAGAAVKVNTNPITGTTTNVTLGPGFYDFFARAVCTTGCPPGITGESADSNHFAVAVTFPPQPPTNFSLLQLVLNAVKKVFVAVAEFFRNIFGGSGIALSGSVSA